MRKLLLRISPALHLTRVTTAFAAAANVWFVILWTRAPHGEVLGQPHEPGFAILRQLPLWALLAGGALNAVALYAYAMALNDVLDHRRDRRLHPDRPIPSGSMPLERALNVVVITLVASVLGATVLGIPAILLTLVLAGAILVFNAAGKYVPAFGLVLLGLLYAGQMVVPNLNLRFVWPVWLVMTHTLAVAGTRHTLGGRSPGISRRAMVCAAGGWAFWSVVMLVFSWFRNQRPGAPWWNALWPEWVSWKAAIGPVLLALVFVIWAIRKAAKLGPGPRAAEKIARYGALWLSLYSCAWFIGQGCNDEAIILGALTLAGFLGMTVLKELYGFFEQPAGYRR